MNISNTESKVLQNIALASVYSKGEAIASAAAEGGLTTELRSLIKKGVVGIYECAHKFSDSTVWITDEGFAAFSELS